MAKNRLRTEEILGLGAATVLHGGLLAVLLIEPAPAAVPPIPERITVSLADDVGLEAMSPDPVPESRAAMAPELAEIFEAPVPELAAAAVSEAAPTEIAPSRTDRTKKAEPKRSEPKKSEPKKSQPKKAQPKKAQPKKSQPKKSGGREIGADFLDGAGTSENTNQTKQQGAVFGAKQQADLRSAINRQLKRHWSSPQGVDADKLVTILRFRLNADGSLAGRPQMLRQSGINASNQAQAAIHAERAIRAVQLAAPFDLPDEFYGEWKYIREWRFDRRL